MDQKKINGFSESQIFQLYDYLVAYEESGIEKFKSTKRLLNEHPELSDLNEQFKKVECKKATAREMKDINFKILNNKVYFTINKGNQLLSFLAHLRNAIAHGNTVEHKGHILITDFTSLRNNTVDFTARGRIEFSVVETITDILKKIEL